MKKYLILLLFSLSVICVFQYGCKTETPPLPSPRDGVVDFPVEAAPDEIWIAAKIWKRKYSTASAVVDTTPDGKRWVTYFLDIGFDSKSWKSKCDEYHNKLLSMGWKLEGEKNYHTLKYTGDGRILHIGFDRGRHPTTLIVKYEKDETGLVKKQGYLPNMIHQHPLIAGSVIPEGYQGYLDVVEDGKRTDTQIIVVYPEYMNQPIDKSRLIQVKGKLYKFTIEKPSNNKVIKMTSDCEAIQVYEWKYVK